jgi:MFS family permease
MFEVGMPDVTTDVAATGLMAALVYATAAFAQLAVGRIIDRHQIKPVLVTVALGQPILIGVMATQTNYALFVATLLAMTFIFGQIPIIDAVLARYVPDVWRAKVLSVKFALNLMIGALALLTAQSILAAGGGFETVLMVLATAAGLIVLAALLLPANAGADAVPAAAAAE